MASDRYHYQGQLQYRSTALPPRYASFGLAAPTLQTSSIVFKNEVIWKVCKLDPILTFENQSPAHLALIVDGDLI
jgi:hypothetical protein